MTISIDQQIEKAERVFRAQIRLYERAVSKGQMALETAAAKQDELGAILATLRFVKRHEDWIRAEAQRRAVIERQTRDLDEVMAQDPAAAAVVAAFPDGAARVVTPASPPPRDDDFPLDPEPVPAQEHAA